MKFISKKSKFGRLNNTQVEDNVDYKGILIKTLRQTHRTMKQKREFTNIFSLIWPIDFQEW